jgi:hypothetical protein
MGGMYEWQSVRHCMKSERRHKLKFAEGEAK